jgi:transglutaminase-like putative cysteine protease
MRKLLRFLRLFADARPRRPARVRLAVESLEARTVPTANSALPPFLPGAPWSLTSNRAFVTAQPIGMLQAMYFNTPASYATYLDYFQGTLHHWVLEAEHAKISSNTGLVRYLGNQENAFFGQVNGVLASLYPGQTAQTYRLLMAMNLADGYYVYASTPGSGRSVYQQLQLRTGDCTEIANLLSILVRAQGIPAQELAQSYNYATPTGPFVSSHVVVYAGGLWLDAEINIAFKASLSQLHQTPPAQRLENLLADQQVFGFYNWYLQPQVRASELAHGLDGGILAFYYQYYFQGIGSGNSIVYFEATS